ncbi:MAG: hypothetical protein JOZ80_04355 [Acidobacteriaceae bacterium]|nr:hypothetical protein [Acidobacteriaceae bacterium]
MSFRSMIDGFLKMLLIVTASLLAGAQTQVAHPAPAAQLQHGNENYWRMVDEFADSAVNFAYAEYFAHVHEGSLTDRQCQQYSRAAVDYAQQLTAVRKVRVSAQTEFWSDVRAYSISMVGSPGVPIPGRRLGKYSVTTGSETGDRELRRIVSLEIDESRSKLNRTTEDSFSALESDCQTAAQELTAAERKPGPQSHAISDGQMRQTN